MRAAKAAVMVTVAIAAGCTAQSGWPVRGVAALCVTCRRSAVGTISGPVAFDPDYARYVYQLGPDGLCVIDAARWAVRWTTPCRLRSARRA